MASKRALRRRSCTGKRQYRSQAEAGYAIVALTIYKGYQGLLVPYRCPFCQFFHFGHPPANVRRAIAARRSHAV